MSDRVEIKVDDLEGFFHELDDIPVGLEDAAVRAANAGARWAAKQAANRIVKAHRLPFASFSAPGHRHNRVRTRVATNGLIGASVWVGHKEIEAKYLGDLFQDARGAGVGGYYWSGAFVARMPTGYISVFKRTGKMRSPSDLRTGRFKLAEQIMEQTAPLTQAEQIMEQIDAELPKRLSDLFEREVNKL